MTRNDTVIMSNVQLPDIPEGDLHWYLKYFKNACKLYTDGDVIKSPIFTAKHRGEYYDWCLHLYPKDFSEENKTHLSIYLKLCGCKALLIRVECTCTIVFSRENRITYSCINNFTQVGERFHFVKTKLTDLIENLKEPDLNILVSVRVWFSENIVSKLLAVCHPEKHEEADVIIKVDDKTFNVHKNVLITQSSVFAAMFRYNTKENKEKCIEIVDIDYLALEQVISFMYKGTVKNLDSLVTKLLYSAEKYAIVGLKNICENYYTKIMTIDNVIDILYIADLYNAVTLKEKAMYFLVLHLKDLIDTYEYKAMASSQPQILDHIIRLTILLNTSNIRKKLVLPCTVMNAFNMIQDEYNDI